MKMSKLSLSVVAAFLLFAQTVAACPPPIVHIPTREEQLVIEARRIEMFGRSILISHKINGEYTIDLNNEPAENGMRSMYWSRSLSAPTTPYFNGFWDELSQRLTQLYGSEASVEVLPYLQNEIPKLTKASDVSIKLYPQTVKEKFIELSQKDDSNCPYVNEIIDIGSGWFHYRSEPTEECFLKMRLAEFQSDIHPVVERDGIAGVIWFFPTRPPTIHLLTSYDPAIDGKLPTIDELEDVIDKKFAHHPYTHGRYQAMGIFKNTEDNKQFLNDEKINTPPNDCSYVSYVELGNWLIAHTMIKESCEKNPNMNPCGAGVEYTPKIKKALWEESITVASQMGRAIGKISSQSIWGAVLFLAFIPGLLLSLIIIAIMRYFRKHMRVKQAHRTDDQQTEEKSIDPPSNGT